MTQDVCVEDVDEEEMDAYEGKYEPLLVKDSSELGDEKQLDVQLPLLIVSLSLLTLPLALSLLILALPAPSPRSPSSTPTTSSKNARA